LWVNAYQAKLWNESVDMNVEKMKLKSFVVRGLGKFPGGERDTVMKVFNFRKEQVEDGVKIKFMLLPGSYATTFLRFLVVKK